MKLINNLPFRYKLVMLVLPALLGMLFFAALSMLERIEVKNSALDIQQLVTVSSHNNSLVHELQKERGATSGFISSKGAQFADVLLKQRQQTDSALAARGQYLQQQGDGIRHPQVNQQLIQIRTLLSSLKEIRQQVDSQQISGKDAIGYYTGINTQLLSVTAEITQLSYDGFVANRLQAYYNFLQGKERAGIERAVMSAVFSHDQFNPQNYRRFIQLTTEQNSYLDTFAKMALPQQRAFFDARMAHDSVKAVNSMRTIALDKAASGGFGIAATEWFQQATGRINQLKAVEDQLTEQLLSLTSQGVNDASRAAQATAFGMLALTVLALVSGLTLMRSLTGQLDSLSRAIVSAAENKQLSARAEVRGEDELGHVAQQFNSMIGVFEEIIREIENKSTQLAAISEQTSSAMSSNHSNLESQRSETTMVATAVEEMTATVQEVATSTSATAEAADQVDEVTDEGVLIVAGTIEKMDSLVAEMNDANQLIGKLRDSSNSIFAVVDVIKSVAEQTNLLALNAAIEAARAGEQGRGFAVVADEVRSLAQRTQESTSEIETLIGKFQDDSTRVSASIESCTSAVDMTAQQAHTMASKLKDIQTAVSSIKDMSRQIATAAEEQVAVTNEIAQNIRSINDLSDRTAVGGEQISAAATEQAQLAAGLHNLSRIFKLS